MRPEWPPVLHQFMLTMDSCGRSDLADELEIIIKSNFTSSEIFGDAGLFLIKIKQTEKEVFEKIQLGYDAYFRHFSGQGLFVGIDY